MAINPSGGTAPLSANVLAGLTAKPDLQANEANPTALPSGEQPSVPGDTNGVAPPNLMGNPPATDLFDGTDFAANGMNASNNSGTSKGRG